MQEIFSEITQPGKELELKSHAYASELRLKKEERLKALETQDPPSAQQDMSS